jgi:hypothetical protein
VRLPSGESKKSSSSRASSSRATSSRSQNVRATTSRDLFCLSSSLEALKQEDCKAIDRIAEEASAKDRTGWFKRTRWDEHLQVYPDWKLLAYAVRLRGDDEAALKQVALAVQELLEQAVRGLDTLSIDTLRWLRSARPNEADARPLGRRQDKGSQQRVARLWARLLCYCVRLVAAEDEEKEEQQRQKMKKPPVKALEGIARLFPWHGRQNKAARLQRIVSRTGGGEESTDTAREARNYMLRLSEELICQDVCHRPFESGIVQFLSVLGINPDTLRLRTAPEYSSLLGSVRVTHHRGLPPL